MSQTHSRSNARDFERRWRTRLNAQPRWTTKQRFTLACRSDGSLPGMIRQRVRAGLKGAVESGKQLGRPKIDPAIEKRIQEAGRPSR
jgi:hypothetical protein